MLPPLISPSSYRQPGSKKYLQVLPAVSVVAFSENQQFDIRKSLHQNRLNGQHNILLRIVEGIPMLTIEIFPFMGRIGYRIQAAIINMAALPCQGFSSY